ncbi:restriction endonuclease [Halocatena marina]|uniref:Restriction endonuclease n=1 Tax=Halocatena marina TaxID=2934937 RepID=A0ABD5YV06_9EURY
MDAYAFELFIGDLWERRGWTTSVSQASNDAGIDVVATKNDPFNQKCVIQVKRYGPTTTVGSPDIQQYASLKQQDSETDTVIVVTTNRFTSQARDRAAELNVKLINGEKLIALIDEEDAYDLVEKHLDTTEFGSPHQTDFSHDRQQPAVDEQVKKILKRNALADISPDVYLGFIVIGTVAWSIGLLLGLIGISGGFVGNAVSVVSINSWLVFPFALYYEAARMAQATEWSPRGMLYAIGGVIPFVNAIVGGYYLFRRRQTCLAEENEELLFTDVSEWQDRLRRI